MERCLLLIAITGSVTVLFLDWHLVSYYLLFELTILILIPVLSSSSRSYRKSYAMFIMTIVIIIGTLFYSVLLCHMLTSEPTAVIAATNVTLVVLVTAIVMLKTPSYPVHSWLPEAHVECTYVGSIVLASIILKYSLAAVILFLPMDFTAPVLLNVCWLVFVSIVVSLISIVCALDLKRLGAYLSIMHMNSGILILFFGTQDTIIAVDML